MSSVPADPESGMTILELLVALSVLAGLLVMVSASIHAWGVSQTSDADRVTAFLVKARTDTILAGQARLLHVSATGLSVAGSELNGLSSSILGSILSGSTGRTIILFANGTISSPLDVETNEPTHLAPQVEK